ncbi:MAG: sodium-dependent transporter, partial [Lachnospiraceae bacterium]|nr:sodium-dependent transporter [Lachnospiraceae bacterium]
MQRERLSSRLGFILLSAGCAIGIGNVWKFPYMAGQYGGGAFVLIYLFFLIVMGVPVLTMEFAMGRASQKSPVKLYQQLEPKGSKWHLHGYMAMIGNYLLMMFYTTVAGWMLQYFVDTASGKFVGADTAKVAALYADMKADPITMTIYMAIVVVLGFLVCSIGLQKGLERITKVMMLALLAIMAVLAVNSIFMDGGSQGLKFYLLPDFGKMQEIGIGKVIVGAMNQAFFTLSLGIGSMAIFGSYIGKERALMGEAVNVAVLDTSVAFTSGLIIFPACFAYNVEANSGPGLIFVTLPNIFNNIPLGRLWGSLFFVFMSFAALSTVLAVFENIISCTTDLLG